MEGQPWGSAGLEYYAVEDGYVRVRRKARSCVGQVQEVVELDEAADVGAGNLAFCRVVRGPAAYLLESLCFPVSRIRHSLWVGGHFR